MSEAIADLHDMAEGDMYECEYCGCEVRVARTGDPAKRSTDRSFTCRCGTKMDKLSDYPRDTELAQSQRAGGQP